MKNLHSWLIAFFRLTLLPRLIWLFFDSLQLLQPLARIIVAMTVVLHYLQCLVGHDEGTATMSVWVRIITRITKLKGSMYPLPALATNATGVISKALRIEHTM